MTNAEALLGITLPASADEVKKAYRRQIARYHPDKVHHLGEEFQVMAAEKSAQLTDIYHQLLESGGCDPSAETTAIVSDEATPPPAAPSTPDAPSGRVHRMSTWQAVAAGCPSLILSAATDRMIQCIRWTMPRAEEFTIAGFSLACRTRVDWRGRIWQRRPSEGVLLRTPADAPATGRRTRVRDLLPGVDGTVVLFDLTLDARAGDRRETADHQAPVLRAEADVFAVSIDAMTWKARVPPNAPEMAHQILARLRDPRV